MRERLKKEYFDELYANSPDPWGFETSDYERRKYARTLEVLGVRQDGRQGGRRFRRALEVGASIGVFTAMLAPFCDELLAVDTSGRAVALARERLAGCGHVRVERRTLPEEMPPGPFDLIVASEVLYYLTPDLVLETLGRLERNLAPGGLLLAVHWRKPTKTYPLLGDEVHELLGQNTRLSNTRTVIEPEYRLDLFEDER